MIPFAIFDGVKVWEWNKAVWVIIAVIAGALMFTSVLMMAPPVV